MVFVSKTCAYRALSHQLHLLVWAFIGSPLAILQAQVAFETPLPIVLLETGGAPIPAEGKLSAWMKVIASDPGVLNRPTDAPNNYDGPIGIELRGSSSLDGSDKKPYAVETRDAMGQDSAVSLLGMPKESDWVFLAPFFDKTLIRDPLAYTLAARLMPWAPRTRFVEVLLNGRYQGVYIIVERIKRDKDRVNIERLEPTDIVGDAVTGGYIFKIDKTSGNQTESWGSHYPMGLGQGPHFYQFHHPKPSDLNAFQKAYLQNWTYRMEDALHGPRFADSLDGYPHYLDVASFIDYTVLNELGKNVDAYRLSTYFYKDRDSKDPRLHAGPIWDFNLAFANADYCDAQRIDDWALRIYGQCAGAPFFWARLWEDRAYRAKFRERWTQLRQGVLSDNNLVFLIDSLADVVRPAQARNFQRWDILGKYIWPNAFCCGTYDQHVDFMRRWVLARAHWIDGAMPSFYIGRYKRERYTTTLAFPNPCRERVVFRYYAPAGEPVHFRLFDLHGRAMGTLTDIPEFNDENREVTWEHGLNPGIYLYEVWFGDHKESEGKLVRI